MRTHFLPLLAKCLWSRANLRHVVLLSGKVTDPSTDSVNTLYATDQILNMTLSKAGLESSEVDSFQICVLYWELNIFST